MFFSDSAPKCTTSILRYIAVGFARLYEFVGLSETSSWWASLPWSFDVLCSGACLELSLKTKCGFLSLLLLLLLFGFLLQNCRNLKYDSAVRDCHNSSTIYFYRAVSSKIIGSTRSNGSSSKVDCTADWTCYRIIYSEPYSKPLVSFRGVWIE